MSALMKQTLGPGQVIGHPPAQHSEIGQSIDRLTQSIQFLYDAQGELSARLNPVKIITPGTASNNACEASASSPIGSALQQAALRIEALTNDIRTEIEQLAI